MKTKNKVATPDTSEIIKTVYKVNRVVSYQLCETFYKSTSVAGGVVGTFYEEKCAKRVMKSLAKRAINPVIEE